LRPDLKTLAQASDLLMWLDKLKIQTALSLDATALLDESKNL
jgi:hypothetical protein